MTTPIQFSMTDIYNERKGKKTYPTVFLIFCIFVFSFIFTGCEDISPIEIHLTSDNLDFVIDHPGSGEDKVTIDVNFTMTWILNRTEIERFRIEPTYDIDNYNRWTNYDSGILDLVNGTVTIEFQPGFAQATKDTFDGIPLGYRLYTDNGVVGTEVESEEFTLTVNY